MKRHESLFTRRQIEPGWNLVQAATLLATAREKSSASFVIYAAVEMRMTIEQLLYIIIAIAKQGTDAATTEECRKKDGLFRVLGEVEPLYSMRCRFANVLAEFYPKVPQIAEWDIRKLRRYFTDLSDLCHSQLIIRDFAENAEYWERQIAFLEEVYEFLAAGMSRSTGIVKLSPEKPIIIRLWEDYSTKKISMEDVRERFAIIKNSLS